MIISPRSANPTYTTDPVAAGLRSVLAAPAAPRASVARQAEPAGRVARVDLALLYPALFAQTPPSRLTRSARAVAFRLSVFGTAALMLGLLHH